MTVALAGLQIGYRGALPGISHLHLHDAGATVGSALTISKFLSSVNLSCNFKQKHHHEASDKQRLALVDKPNVLNAAAWMFQRPDEWRSVPEQGLPWIHPGLYLLPTPVVCPLNPLWDNDFSQYFQTFALTSVRIFHSGFAPVAPHASWYLRFLSAFPHVCQAPSRERFHCPGEYYLSDEKNMCRRWWCMRHFEHTQSSLSSSGPSHVCTAKWNGHWWCKTNREHITPPVRNQNYRL